MAHGNTVVHPARECVCDRSFPEGTDDKLAERPGDSAVQLESMCEVPKNLDASASPGSRSTVPGHAIQAIEFSSTIY
jgi:hypothetical protein